MNYPQAEGEAGAPFHNPNLKLVVLDALLSAKTIELGQPEELARFVLGREVDLDTEAEEVFPQMYDYLTRYPLTRAQIESVRELAFDGGNEIYQLAWYLWDGESDEFNITTLAGIEKCVNLTEFNECTMVDNCDLAYLVPLQKLTTVSLNECEHRNGAALLELKNLRSLACFESSFPDPQVLKSLEAKGIAIKLYC
jgi:hypothetical protein